MAEYTNDLALIVRYDGTKADFDGVKSNYLGKVVFIYGSKTEVTNQAGLVQAIWVSDSNGGRYLDMANVEYIRNNLTHISGIKVDDTTYYPSSGGGAIELKGSEGIRVIVNSQTGEVIFSGADLKTAIVGTTSNNSDTTTHPDTIKGAKAYTDKVAGDLKGTRAAGDTTAETIRGAKDYADKVKSDLEGTASDNKDSATIMGAKKYADYAVAKIVSDGNDAATDDTIKGAKMYTDEAKESLLGDANDDIDDNTILGVKNYAKQMATDGKVSIIESEGTGDIGKVYTFYQGGTTEGYKIGVINTPKELVVKSGQVVVNPTGQPAGTYIELTIQNQDAPLYINVADLVDVYTAAQGAAEVQLAISATNEISATIKAVSGTKIINKTITKDKLGETVQASLGLADSAYQKPSTGIPKSDLASEVTNSLDNAVMEVGVQATDTDYLSFSVNKSGTTRTISYDVKTDNTIGDAINDTTKKGLATVEDVAAYLKKRLSVKVVS